MRKGEDQQKSKTMNQSISNVTDGIDELLKNMHMGVMIHDASFKTVYANETANRILGIDQETLLKGTATDGLQRVFDIDGKEIKQHEVPHVVALSTGKPVNNKINGLQLPGKDLIWLLINAIPEFRNGEGKPYRSITIFSEITTQIESTTQIRYQAEVLEMINRISTRFMNIDADKLNELIDLSMKELGKFVDSDRCYVFIYDLQLQTASNTHEWCAEGISKQIDQLQRIPMESFSEWRDTHDRGETILIPSVEEYTENDAVRELLISQEIKSLVAVPLMHNQECIGFVGLDWVKNYHTTIPGEQTMLQLFGTILARVLDRVATAEEIRTNQERLRGLMDSQTNYLIRTDLTGMHTFWNQKFMDDFGWLYPNLGQVPGESMLSICDYHHDKTRRVVEMCMVNPGKIVKVELDKPKQGGGTVTTLWEFVCLTNDNGEPTEMQCIGLDISERKKSERELFNSQELYKSLIESSDSAIILVSQEGENKYLNDVAASMFGKPSNDIIGTNLKDMFPIVIAESLIKDVSQVLNTKHGINKEILLPMNGLQIWFRVSMQPVLNELGNPILVLINANNITALKQAEIRIKDSEQKYKSLFYNSPDPYLIIDSGKFIECNESALRQMGATMSSDLIGKTPLDISPKVQPDGSLSEIKSNEKILEAYRIGHTSFEWLHKRMNGTEFLAFIQLSVIDYQGKKVLFTTWKDITKERAVQIALAISEQRFREVATHSKSVIWECDMTGLYTYISPIVQEVMGYGASELENKVHFFDLFPDEYKEEFNHEAARVIRTGGPFTDFINPIKCKDGKVIWVNTNGTPVYDAKGEMIGYRGADTDITENKLAEEEKNKFKIIVDQAGYGVAIASMDGMMLYCNKSWCDMHSMTPEEILNKPLMLNHHETQLPRVLELINHLKQTGEFVSEEVGHMRKDGSLFPTLMSCKVISNDKGVPMFMSATVIDISEIKQAEQVIKESEEKLNYAQEMALMGSWEYSLTTRQTNWSKGFFKLTERVYDGKSVSYEDFVSCMHPDDAPLLSLHLNKMIETRLPTTMEFRMLMPDGRIKWIQNNIVPYFEGDQLTQLKGVNIDITEQKKKDKEILELNQHLEEKIAIRTKDLEKSNSELVIARQEADKANQSKSDFLSRMSHELRTPMNSILGFSQLMEMGALDDNQRKGVNHIINSGKHLLKLINEILDIARIESGKISVSVESVVLNLLVEEIRDVLMPLASEKQIRIHLNNEDFENLHVKADQQRLKQVLMNLMSNAIKYNKSGGDIWLRAFVIKDNNGETVHLSVKDNGIGIASIKLNKLFMPFERLDADKSNIEGTGLGLSMVKQLTEMMGGKVGVESTEGKGSTFWIELPIGEREIDRVKKGGSLDTIEVKSEIAIGSVVYIEDNQSNIELVEDILLTKRPEVKLVVGRYGSLAVEMTAVHKPCLILLDLDLPDIHGQEVLARLKADPRTQHLPVVIVSADALPKQIENLIKKGAEAYLTKPLEINEFLTTIDKYCCL